MTALRWRDITLSKGGRLILDGVSLSAKRGEVLGIVGPNGAGKTALLRCAAGLEGRDHGHRVDIGGVSAASLSPSARARAMAYLPQQGEAAWPVTAAAAVALGRLPHGDAKSDDDARAVARALDAVGAAALAHRPLTTLSGGERALVLLARALAVEAEVLLLDEPAAALDPHHQLATMTLLRRLAEDGKAVCVVMHDLFLAARFCHRVAVLHGGRLIAEGTPETTLTDEVLERVYAIRGLRRCIDGAQLLVPWERLP